MRKFIFDVDGTLTPSRQVINPEFKTWFIDFIKQEKVFLVTGSDYPKTLEQVGPEICENVVCVYNCAGNDVWFKGKRVNSKPFDPPKELYDLMYSWLQASTFPARMGQHIEKRQGMINFSIVGRGATLAERKMYADFDNVNRERESIALAINSTFDDITATIGGETGIDIYRTGCDKSQILEDFSTDDTIYFFGDRMTQGGNDYELANKLTRNRYRGKNFEVTGWKDTWQYLKDLS